MPPLRLLADEQETSEEPRESLKREREDDNEPG